jgi:hypothetical protein
MDLPELLQTVMQMETKLDLVYGGLEAVEDVTLVPILELSTEMAEISTILADGMDIGDISTEAASTLVSMLSETNA